MIKCLVVDDEPNAHLVLENYIRRTEGLVIEGKAYHVDEAKALLEKQEFDLVFLDINMPDLSGFELVLSNEYHLPTILTTAYREHAIDAYEHGILDYLLKPFSFERFTKAVDRYRKGNNVEEDKVQPTFIALKVAGEMVNFSIPDIVYIQSWGNYVKLFTMTESFICSSTTREIELKLRGGVFMRIHKSYVVNIKYVESFDIDYVILTNQTYLPVGITYRKLLSGII